MPGRTRMYIPGLPCDPVRRGNNRKARFFDDESSSFNPEIREVVLRQGVAAHAICLAASHIHFNAGIRSKYRSRHQQRRKSF